MTFEFDNGQNIKLRFERNINIVSVRIIPSDNNQFIGDISASVTPVPKEFRPTISIALFVGNQDEVSGFIHFDSAGLLKCKITKTLTGYVEKTLTYLTPNASS